MTISAGRSGAVEPQAEDQIDLTTPAQAPPRRGRGLVLVAAALVAGLVLGVAGARLLARDGWSGAGTTALGQAPPEDLERSAAQRVPSLDAGVPAPPPPTGDPLPVEQATTPEAAVAGFLTAEARGDFAASYAFLSAADRETYPSPAAWEAAHADFPPVTGFAVEEVREGGTVVTLLALRSTLDPVMGLIPARSRATWETVEEQGGRRVGFTSATATPIYPSDAPVAEVARRWATARQSCTTEAQVDAALLGSPALADHLCGSHGEIVLGATGVLTDAADTTALLDAYGPEVYTWARAVDLDAPVRLRVVLGPVDDQWRVVAVLPRG